MNTSGINQILEDPDVDEERVQRLTWWVNEPCWKQWSVNSQSTDYDLSSSLSSATLAACALVQIHFSEQLYPCL